MIRSLHLIFATTLVFAGTPIVQTIAAPAGIQLAANDTPHSAKSKAAKSKADNKSKKPSRKGESSDDDESTSGKPEQIASFGDWGAFLAGGKDKTCYVLAEPKDRQPSKPKRDPAYVFISSRPEENIHNEVSITMGFLMKDGSNAQADVAGTSFDLVSKGKNAWVKNPAEEAKFISAMRKNAKLVITATSAKGKVTTDSYSLEGLSQALDRVQKECQ